MKRLILLFTALFCGFLGVWAYRISTPVNRPDEYAEGYDPQAGAWWATGKVEVDDSWRLDPEIPLNYKPVPGENELYMVVDNDGKIIGYRKRTKQIDGSWLWEDINPDIPEDYEPVPGLKDVYKVTAQDGSVSYYKYIRNTDDTYAFVPVDEKGTPLEKNRDATIIDGKHVHITGNIYSELNDKGVVIGYDKRMENPDGTFSWTPTQVPSLPSINSGLAAPQDPMGNSGFLDGMKNQMDQIANTPTSGDDYNITVNINRNPQANQDGYQGDGQQPPAEGNPPGSYPLPDGPVPPDIPELPGVDAPPQGTVPPSGEVQPGGNGQAGGLKPPAVPTPPAETPVVTPGGIFDDGSMPTIVNNSDGTHVEIETIRETKNIDGWETIYETTVKKTYDDSGNLISTSSDGPYEVDSSKNIVDGPVPTGSPDDKEFSLAGELVRVSGNFTYVDSVANDMVARLNAQRTSNGIASLQVTETALQVAKIRAADMAAYDTAKENLPTYGDLGTMLSYYGVTSAAPGENIWKSTIRGADDIHTRFQTVDSARNTRMNPEASQVGAAVIERNGYYYICEVIL